MITQSKPERTTSSRDICRILFRHKKKIVGGFLFALTVAAGVIFLWPRKYESEAKLYVRVGRETVTLDPTATTGQVIPVELSRETEVNSVLEMLRSRVMIEKLVDKIGPQAILHAGSEAEDSGKQPPSVLSNVSSLLDVDPVSDREKAIIRLSRSLRSSAEKKSDVITVSGTAISPKLAQQIVAKFVDIYLGEHTRMHRTAGSQAFFTEQTGLLRKSLSDALIKLRDAKNELGILSIENQREVLRDETVAAETRLAQTRAGLAASREKVEALKQKVKGLPERLATDETKGLPNPAADGMRHELYQLEIREAELASRFNNEFPALVAVRAQIEAAKKPLSNEEHRRSQQTTGVNLVRDQLQVSLLSEESSAASLEAETKSLETQLAELHDRARNLNQHEWKIANLEQEVALCKANYTTYSEKSEQTRIDAALQNERITNVNVIQPANLIEKPISPRKLLVLLAGIFGGLAFGIGLALLAELLDPTLKTPSDIEEHLSLPVLLSIPRVTKRQAILN
jgi:uncharacterized protein involved in exopolysaccharide biosynthesis